MIALALAFFVRSPVGLQVLLCAAGALLITTIGLGVTVKIQGARLQVAQVQVQALGEEVAAQNRAVAAWKAEAGKQAASALEAAARAEKVRTVTVDRVRTVTIATIPPACPDAVKWGAEHAHDAVQGWEDDDL